MSKDHLVNNQYKNSANINARIRVHELFSTNKQGFHEWVFEKFELKDGMNILECGCGPAALWYKNLDKIPNDINITLIDLSPGMLSDAEAKLNNSRFSYVQADIQELIPFADNSFDIVIANHMLYHVNDNRDKAFSEIKRVLKSGGRFHASTFGLSHLKEIDELTRKFVDIPKKRTSDSFTLENGMRQIKPFFPNTTMLRHEDSLNITQAKPLIDYILSSSKVRNQIDDERLTLMTSCIGEAIESKGNIYVTKDAGTFISLN